VAANRKKKAGSLFPVFVLRAGVLVVASADDGAVERDESRPADEREDERVAVRNDDPLVPRKPPPQQEIKFPRSVGPCRKLR